MNNINSERTRLNEKKNWWYTSVHVGYESIDGPFSNRTILFFDVFFSSFFFGSALCKNDEK